MSKDTKMKKRISKTRQAKMREKGLKSTLKFGVKLVLILAVAIGCVQSFFYGKNVVAGRSNGPVVRIAVKNSETRNNQLDSIKIGEQGNVSGSFLSDSEKDRQQIPETIASSAKFSDGPGNVVQAAPPSGDTPLDLAGGKNESSPVSGSANASKPMIAFTFDDGPHYSVDIRILDTLQAYGSRAISFIIGSRVSDYRDTLKRIRDSGSEVGDYIFNHRNLEKTFPEEATSQTKMTNDAVEAITGFWPKLVRVPYGALKSQVPGLVSYPTIQWNADTQNRSNKDKDAIAVSVLSQIRNGSIVLMHDLCPATAEVFEMVIPLLAVQGYQFVTVSGMYVAKGVPLEAGQVYFSIPN